MNKIFYIIIFSIALTFLTYSPGKAQCSTSIAPQATCTGTAFTGQSISSGTYISTGTNAVNTTNVNITGGTLIICSGTLTLTGSQLFFGFNATNPCSIIVNAGATLTFNSSNLYLYNNATLTNYGTINVNASSAVSYISGYSNSNIVNAASGTINSVVDITFAGANGTLINYGNLTVPGITVNSTGRICLGSNSRLNATNLTNAGTNHSMFNLIPGASQACLRLAGTYTPGGAGNVISSDAGVRVCSAAPTTPSAANAGDATVSYSCTSCNVALPVEISTFTAVKSGAQAKISFETLNEIEIAGFEVERSTTDGFKSISNYIPAFNKQKNHYEFTDTKPADGINLYRIKITGLNNTVSYTATRKTEFGQTAKAVVIYPNPAQEEVKLTLNGYQTQDNISVAVSDLTGKTVAVLYSGQYDAMPAGISLKNVPSGIYILTVSANYTLVHKEKLVVIK